MSGNMDEPMDRFGPGRMAPEGLGKIQLAPDPEVAQAYMEKRADKPFYPDRAYLVALGFLSYIKGDTSKESVKMLAELLKNWGDNG